MNQVINRLYAAGARRFFIMGVPPLHDSPTMRVMAPTLAASDLGRLAALGLQTGLDAATQAPHPNPTPARTPSCHRAHDPLLLLSASRL